MADPLYEILLPHLSTREQYGSSTPSPSISKYISRLASLHPSDLTTTESQSLTQSSQSTNLSLQALSSRSHRSTTVSSDQLSTLQTSLPVLSSTAKTIKDGISGLDDSASTFATTYSRARTADPGPRDDPSNNLLQSRKQSLLLSNSASSLQDILDLPSLLTSSITSASATASSTANYQQALDIYAHIKRLQTLYPESKLVASIQNPADEAIQVMSTNLLNTLKTPNLRLPAAIRTVGWLRRVLPELSSTTIIDTNPVSSTSVNRSNNSTTPLNLSSLGLNTSESQQQEGSFGALFLVSRLSTFLTMTIDGLAPLRDLADQETEKRLQSQSHSQSRTPNHAIPSQLLRRSSTQTTFSSTMTGQQTEKYLKRYIEIFREQSFNTIQMYRNIFPPPVNTTASGLDNQDTLLTLPSALASFPLHLVTLLTEQLQLYLPNISDTTTQESLLVQVLYAANSLGRLGADFSMLLALLDLPGNNRPVIAGSGTDAGEEKPDEEPLWYRVVRKHRVQAARLDALAARSGENSNS